MLTTVWLYGLVLELVKFSGLYLVSKLSDKIGIGAPLVLSMTKPAIWQYTHTYIKRVTLSIMHGKYWREELSVSSTLAT